MVAGLTQSEELALASAENRRYRAALELALRGLAAARDHGFTGASDVIADINAVLVPKTPPAPVQPLWPPLAALIRWLFGRAAAQ
jgi:hypothetical protein